MSTRYRTGRQSLSSRERRLASARLRAKRLPCHLCGNPIDYRLTWPHPWSFSVDEYIPRSKGGSSVDPRNLRAAHLGHNSARGNQPVHVAIARLRATRAPMPRSQTW